MCGREEKKDVSDAWRDEMAIDRQRDKQTEGTRLQD